MKQLLGVFFTFLVLFWGNTSLVHAVTLSSLSLDGSNDFITSVLLPNGSAFTVEGNNSRKVDIFDLSILLRNFGK